MDSGVSSHAEWRLCTSEPNPSCGRRYERLLGPNELGFYWDSVYRGTADTLQHAICEETKTQAELNIQSEASVRAAWVALKMQYPLLGSSIEERRRSKTDGADDLSPAQQNNSSEEIYFVVDPARIGDHHAHPKEVLFFSCDSEEDAITLEEGIINGFGWPDVQAWAGIKDEHVHESSSSRLLSNELPACILFIRRRDNPLTFHVMIHVAHLITDGIGNSMLLSNFFDLLSRGSANNSIGMEGLEHRLKLSVASESLYPDLKPGYSIARRTWHRVLGKVLFALRNARMTGGHTLPRMFRASTPYTPAKSSNITYMFTPAHTLNILRKCKDLGITFGNAHPVLGQIAVTRVLLRRRLRTLFKRQQKSPNVNENSEEDIDVNEWVYRRRQPMITGGPANLRTYLDKEWYANGGAANVCLSIGFFSFTLPFMPLGEAGILADGNSAIIPAASGDVEVPPFQKMISRKRFLLRCNMIQKQSSEVFRHPRFLDIGAARMPMRVERSRMVALIWRNDVAGPIKGDDAPIPAPEQPQSIGVVTMHGGSSFGNSDHLVPPYYPRTSPSASQTRSTLHLIKSVTRLRCRPTELYLGAVTARGQLRLNVFWDENVYRREVVEEWLDEVRRATEWFLGAEDGTELALTDSEDVERGGVTPPVVFMAKM
ncbi:hypothetical protein BDP27DRAFT_1312824 [Rhodocollybia butyracea]|uniref:Uncharacterized protein n=1 Tax=Rhodocollybia butyracea TaxID=206335 RepID=A0A9P5Q803_9AGAR|nr:hypothetical protein BDP27DRAFT_1312824 [Rhodocollybia butyracea]